MEIGNAGFPQPNLMKESHYGSNLPWKVAWEMWSLDYKKWGAWVAQPVKRLPLAQVMIPGSWDRVLHWAPCSAGSLLLPLPTALPACAFSKK